MATTLTSREEPKAAEYAGGTVTIFFLDSSFRGRVVGGMVWGRLGGRRSYIVTSFRITFHAVASGEKRQPWLTLPLMDFYR